MDQGTQGCEVRECTLEQSGLGPLGNTTTTTNLGVRERGADLFAAGVDEVPLQRPRVEPAQDEDMEARSQH